MDLPIVEIVLVSRLDELEFFSFVLLQITPLNKIVFILKTFCTDRNKI